MIVSSGDKEANCELCHPDKDDKQRIVFKNDFCLFLQKHEKVLRGSGIIIPKVHRKNVFDLSDDEWNATFLLLKKAKSFLEDRYQPDGYNIG